MHNLTFGIFPKLKNDREQQATDPADSQILLRNVAPLIEPVGPRKQSLNLFEPNSAPGISSEKVDSFANRS